jgi:hypothetical protein
MSKKEVGTHVISTGKRYRQLVEITKGSGGRRESRTYHEEKINGNWVARPEKKKARR